MKSSIPVDVHADLDPCVVIHHHWGYKSQPATTGEPDDVGARRTHTGSRSAFPEQPAARHPMNHPGARGEVFKAEDQSKAALRIKNLVEYLRSIQEPAIPK